jgi:hypothetical protein
LRPASGPAPTVMCLLQSRRHMRRDVVMPEGAMPRYYARMLDANTSGEGSYAFEGPAD